MQINLEAPDSFAVQSYDQRQVTINNESYSQNLIVSRQGIVTDWPVESIKDLQNLSLEMLLKTQPEVILIGHENLAAFAPQASRDLLLQKGIGFESMSIGSACRTYNILLGENREVVLAIIWGG